jgi:hypothetical protein
MRFFDRLEDRIRGWLSRRPILYAFIGSVGIILLWRGVWMVADDFNLGGWASIVIGTAVLLLIGLFVSFFIGEQIIISGIKSEKRTDEKTEEEIRGESAVLKQIKSDLEEIKKAIREIKK